jgi:hypothetical protein
MKYTLRIIKWLSPQAFYSPSPERWQPRRHKRRRIPLWLPRIALAARDAIHFKTIALKGFYKESRFESK